MLFKLDDSGNGKLIEISQLGKANQGLVVNLPPFLPPSLPSSPSLFHYMNMRIIMSAGIYNRLISAHVYPVWLWLPSLCARYWARQGSQTDEEVQQRPIQSEPQYTHPQAVKSHEVIGHISTVETFSKNVSFNSG